MEQQINEKQLLVKIKDKDLIARIPEKRLFSATLTSNPDLKCFHLEIGIISDVICPQYVEVSNDYTNDEKLEIAMKIWKILEVLK